MSPTPSHWRPNPIAKRASTKSWSPAKRRRATAAAVGVEAEPDREPGVDEVVVAVEAAPINGADLLFAAGWFAVYPQVPAALGAEGAGRGVSAGSPADPALTGRSALT